MMSDDGHDDDPDQGWRRPARPGRLESPCKREMKRSSTVGVLVVVVVVVSQVGREDALLDIINPLERAREREKEI